MSSDKRLDIVDIIDKILYELKSQITKKIRISSESEIDKILSEPEVRLNFIQALLQQHIAAVVINADQQAFQLPNPLISDTIKKTVKSKQSQKKAANNKTDEIPIEIVQLAEHLKIANSREEGKVVLTEYLNKYRNVKERLVLLAKHLKISIGKLNKDKLTEKIIQETIGYRIDSMIIQEHKWDK